jgi:hypothetical protein
MINDKIRQDFEAHTRTLPNFTEDMLRRKPNGAYWEPTIYAAFEGYQAGRAAERAEIVAKLKADDAIYIVSDVVDDMADRNLALDGNGKPILYNAVGITEAAITKILEVI